MPLSRDRVLEAAVQVADEQGIDAVTLRRLAERLGVHPTSIYHHLANKEAILDGLAEHLFEESGLGPDVSDWQDWVWTFATALRRLARAHPGAVAVYTRRAAIGRAADEHIEAALA
ncbi:MAG: TetR family transcriptional regulator, partial [Actinobacteria bacterium]|nr:TetR family transcriptional regulator [Actinomycetota bacterium]